MAFRLEAALSEYLAERARKDAEARAELRRMKLAQKNANQRNRRAKHCRIDYYVSAAALAIINAQCKPQAGYDASSVINRLIESAGQSTAVPTNRTGVMQETAPACTPSQQECNQVS